LLTGPAFGHASFTNHLSATIPMPIATTPIKTTIEIPPYIMASIDVTAIKVFLFSENLV